MNRRAVVFSVLGLLLFAAAIGVGGVVFYRGQLQAQVARAQRIDSPHGVDSLEIVEVNGARHYIHIRGQDRRNPVLLYLHGGPGTTMMPFSHVFQDRLEKHFTVVQWDQRGAGKTYALNDPAETREKMSMQLMQDDVVGMTNLLRKRFNQPKIVLLGHSWGSIIGLPVVKAHPELFYAYVGTGQTIDPRRSALLGRAHTTQLARKMGLTEAVEELDALGPNFPPAEGWAGEGDEVRLKWNQYFGESVFGYQDLGKAMIAKAWSSPDYTFADVWRLANDTDVYDKLQTSIYSYDAFKIAREWPIPMIWIEGRFDWQVNNLLVLEYYRAITAPRKEFYYIEDGAHAPMIEQPDQFAEILIKRVLPLTRGQVPVEAVEATAQ